MKTTVNLPDELVREAQEVARQQRTTLRELIETGLRAVVNQRSSDTPFELADRSVDGRGLQQEFRNAPWQRMRDTIHEHPA